jgi:hypothetical protein
MTVLAEMYGFDPINVLWEANRGVGASEPDERGASPKYGAPIKAPGKRRDRAEEVTMDREILGLFDTISARVSGCSSECITSKTVIPRSQLRRGKTEKGKTYVHVGTE